MQHKTMAELASRWLSRNAEALTEGERRVLQSAIERKTVARDTTRPHKEAARLGDRVADAVARIGGSWNFIIGFLVFLAAWTALNSLLLLSGAFDPYPYIFLNLILSMLAAIQAPVIMMSQNRQAAEARSASRPLHRLQPAKRQNTAARPAWAPSPCRVMKISFTA